MQINNSEVQAKAMALAAIQHPQPWPDLSGLVQLEMVEKAAAQLGVADVTVYLADNEKSFSIAEAKEALTNGYTFVGGTTTIAGDISASTAAYAGQIITSFEPDAGGVLFTGSITGARIGAVSFTSTTQGLESPLPCNILIANVEFKAGAPLSELVNFTKGLWRTLYRLDPDCFSDLTAEERAAFEKSYAQALEETPERDVAAYQLYMAESTHRAHTPPWYQLSEDLKNHWREQADKAKSNNETAP